MRFVLACTLLVLVPLTSVRMVCLEARGADASARAAVAGAIEAAPQCDHICVKRAAPKPPPRDEICVLVSDPSCTYLAAAAIAVVPAAPAPPAVHRAAPFEAASTERYLAPALARHCPPPKS